MGLQQNRLAFICLLLCVVLSISIGEPTWRWPNAPFLRSGSGWREDEASGWFFLFGIITSSFIQCGALHHWHCSLGVRASSPWKLLHLSPKILCRTSGGRKPRGTR